MQSTKEILANTIQSANDRPENAQCQSCGVTIEPKFADRSFLGMPPIWFKPEQNCTSCNKRFEAVQKKEIQIAEEKSKIEKTLKMAKVSKSFSNRTFDRFNATSSNGAAMAFAESYVPIEEGIVFVGSCGVGKTHLASAVANKHAKNISFLFVSCPELLHQIRLSYNSNSKVDLLEYAKKIPLLLLDDIGAEKPTEWVRETLYLLIDHRSEERLPTIFTTNCTMNELADKLGDRIASRITGMCKVIKMNGEDYRLKGR